MQPGQIRSALANAFGEEASAKFQGLLQQVSILCFSISLDAWDQIWDQICVDLECTL